MSLLSSLLLFAVSVFVLIKGAEWLVAGASSLAKRFSISDLAIGLTIVAFGTSMPELLVNIIASLRGSEDIAIGNILGSNISNTLLILGVTAIIAPLAIQRSTVIKEIPFSILAALILFIMANDAMIDHLDASVLTRSDGMAFIGFFLIFLYYTFGIQRNNDADIEDGIVVLPIWQSLGSVLGGLLALSVGGKYAVESAQSIALGLGVSEALVGLTAVAVGTSLPELTTSIVAALKSKPDISVGNIVGSNIFNIFWILGVSSIIHPIPFRPAMNVDLSVVLGCAIALFILVHNGHVHSRLFLWWKQKKNYILNRYEGGILLACYIAYIVFVSYRG